MALYQNTQDPYADAQANYLGKINQLINADTASDHWHKLQGGLSGGVKGINYLNEWSAKQQAAALAKTADTLQSDVAGLSKRAYSIKTQVDQIFELLFGPMPETCEKVSEGHTPSIDGDLKEAYDVLSGVDARLSALLTRVGGR